MQIIPWVPIQPTKTLPLQPYFIIKSNYQLNYTIPEGKKMNDKPKNSITSRTWIIMAALAFTGQIAWAVENSWFNTFVFDTITPDPRPVAWMVAASAITATLTTLLMGTLSDRTRSRWGRRILLLRCAGDRPQFDSHHGGGVDQFTPRR